MSAPVDVSIISLIVVAQGIQYRYRLLRGGGIVEIHQGFAVNVLMQNREIAAHLGSNGSFLSNGHWLLVIGYWSLVIDYWLLANNKQQTTKTFCMQHIEQAFGAVKQQECG
jgi:hypothetical protein